MSERTNEQWVADLHGAPGVQAQALEDLRMRLQRSILYYLSHERSDLASRSSQELSQMADDLAQDATLRVMENLSTFRGDSRFTTWANKIAVRLAISELRRVRHKDFSLDDMTADGDLQIENTTVSALNGTTPPDPERATERAEVLQKIDQALSEVLTPRQYQALVAIAMRDIPMDVVAEQMGSNRNALYKLLHDARRKLRLYLESQDLPIDYMLELFH
ncbi:MAG: sigma-70 family RNA polymerase sigma factor [Chloroflexi bacterium]|nr:sigma-70 family RNA polymerase sigma factor [Chloroflexota bacterium]